MENVPKKVMPSFRTLIKMEFTWKKSHITASHKLKNITEKLYCSDFELFFVGTIPYVFTFYKGGYGIFRYGP